MFNLFGMGTEPEPVPQPRSSLLGNLQVQAPNRPSMEFLSSLGTGNRPSPNELASLGLGQGNAPGLTPSFGPISSIQGGVPTPAAASPVVVTPEDTFANTMMDEFATSEGGETVDAGNAQHTYPFGVEKRTLTAQGINREDFKNPDGTYRDRDVAKEVFKKMLPTFKANHPSWLKFPSGVQKALMSYHWNTGGTGVSLKKGVNDAMGLDTETKQKAKMVSTLKDQMLDTVGTKKDGVKYSMMGLVKRRSTDYNMAMDDLGSPKIASYKLEQLTKEEVATSGKKKTIKVVKAGSKATYYDAAGKVIKSITMKTRNVHPNSSTGKVTL